MKAAKKTFSVVVNKIWAWVKLILWRKEPRYRVIRWTVVVLMSLGIFSYLTNPFVRFSIVTDPYAKIVLEESGFDLEIDDSILIKDGVFTQRLAVIKSGWHILSSKLAGGRRVQESTVDNIIRELHKERFDPSNPFLISGDHFSVLYNRSLGIFYHSLLDHRTALDEQDWQHRQQIYLKRLAYALQVYAQSDVLSTTIVPVGPRSVALMNIYAYPSDTLYSLLYAIRALQDESVAQGLYRFEGSGKYKLETTEVTNRLVERYKEDLVRHVGSYIETVVDPETGLVRKDIYLSGTKDLAKRESAFYDNVILWRT